jgi:predicted Zn-dependent protease
MLNMASIPLMMVGGPIGYIGYEALSIASPLTYLKFTRHFESEADFLGIQYMYKAGYDPQALTSFFEKIKSMEDGKQSVVAKAFRTHPQTPDRIQKTQAEINTLLPPRTEYTVDTSDFEDAKTHLRSLEDPGHLQFKKTFQPTLRRRMPTGEDENRPDEGQQK